MRSAIASRFLLVLCLLLVGRSAYAQEDKALAQALFDEGRELMRQAKYAEACPKLAESLRLDAALGTKLNLALCHEHEGKTATAWSEYQDALSEARKRGDTKREQFALEHIAALQPRIARVIVKVAPDHEVPGLEVTRDGTPLKKPSWGSELPIDPGEHVFAASAPGYEHWEQKVVIEPGPSNQTVEVPKLTRAPPSAEGAASTPPAPSRALAPQPTRDPDRSDEDPGKTQRIAGFVVGGVGVAAVIVGVAFGVAAIRQEAKADEECNPETSPTNADGNILCNSEAVAASNDAKLDALLSNIFLFSGIGLAGVGLVVVLTAPNGDETATLEAQVGPSRAGASLKIRF